MYALLRPRRKRLAELFLGEIPLLVGAELVRRSEGELDPHGQVEEIVEVVRVGLVFQL